VQTDDLDGGRIRIRKGGYAARGRELVELLLCRSCAPGTGGGLTVTVLLL